MTAEDGQGGDESDRTIYDRRLLVSTDDDQGFVADSQPVQTDRLDGSTITTYLEALRLLTSPDISGVLDYNNLYCLFIGEGRRYDNHKGTFGIGDKGGRATSEDYALVGSQVIAVIDGNDPVQGGKDAGEILLSRLLFVNKLG